MNVRVNGYTQGKMDILVGTAAAPGEAGHVVIKSLHGIDYSRESAKNQTFNT